MAASPTRRAHSSSAVFMDTVVTLESDAVMSDEAWHEATTRAFGWFAKVEARCTRFDPTSDLGLLAGVVDTPMRVSEIAFAALEFALRLAEATGGAFDPTVGATLEARGFARDYRTGTQITRALEQGVSFRDVEVDAESRTVTCRRPLALDLGAVAKGLAVDLAAAALEGCEPFSINAGGDLLVRGASPEDGAWRVGVRDPAEPTELVEVLRVRDASVCTSGDYERVSKSGATHIVAPSGARAGLERSDATRSVTVVAANTMLADALATAAFVLGPERALPLLAAEGAEALFVTASGRLIATAGLECFR